MTGTDDSSGYLMSRVNNTVYYEKTTTLKEVIIMKTFWKVYKELCKETGMFYKKHWKGCVVLNAAIVGAELLWFNRNNIKNYVETKVEEEN